MLFQSFGFLLFLLVIWLCYWKIPSRYRWCLMLAAGCFYYALWDFQYIALILSVAGIAYVSAHAIENRRNKKKNILIISIVLELLILCFFKYAGFLGKICSDILSLVRSPAQISIFQLALPIGISFYIFQTIAYVIDVYREKTTAERHFGYFAESVMFFPILLAGPIEKIQYLTAQFKKEQKFSYENGCMAFQRILLGYMKKLIIADSIASIVNRIYSDADTYRGFPLLIAILLYSIEIYCDFSGYSDIAVGTAGLFGIHIHDNFRQPYFADSINDFWKRWHISLTSWFREYLYIPLGGNRVPAWKNVRNVMCVYLLSGLWHGADWTFLVWGGLNGVVQVMENMLNKCNKIKNIFFPKIVKQIGTYILVSIMWVFFRMESVGDAVFVLSHCLDGIGSLGTYLRSGINLLGIPRMQCGLLAVFIGILSAVDWRAEKGIIRKYRGLTLSVLIFLSMIYYLKYGIDGGTFIYFQF